MKLSILLLLCSLSLFSKGIVVTKPFVRLLPPSAPNTGGFMQLKNTTDKDISLLKAKSSLSKVLELHTLIEEDGMSKMREVDSILIKANSAVSLEPGGLHLMFMGLKSALKKGTRVKIKLYFSNSSTLDIEAPILDK